MMVGVMITAIGSGIAITKTGRYKIFPVVGLAITDGAASRGSRRSPATCRCGSSAP